MTAVLLEENLRSCNCVVVLIRIRCEPVSELHHQPNRYLGFIFGSVSPDSGGSVSDFTHVRFFTHVLSRRSASRCVCQSKVRCGSIVKYLLIWGQSKATVSIEMPLNINNGSLKNSQRPATRAHLRNATVTSLARISPVQMMLFNKRAFPSLIKTFSNSRTDYVFKCCHLYSHI